MPPSSPRESRLSALVARPLPAWLAVAGVFAATLLTYSAALRAGFVWNDLDYVTRPDLRSLPGLWRIWFEVGSTEQHYPLLHTAFWLEHRLWGDSPAGYHLVNVLLHATAACLLAFCVRRLLAIQSVTHCVTLPPHAPAPAGAIVAAGAARCTSAPALPSPVAIAWLAALLFALHPVGVESVAWISEQKNTLSLVCYLAASLAYLRFDTSRTRSTYRLATALYVLALLSKSLTATLPPALLVVFWWRRGRLEWRRDVVPLLPWFFLGALFGLFSAWVEHAFLGTTGREFDLSFLQRLLIAGRSVWFYLGKLLWPAGLVFIYPRWTVDPADVDQWLFPLAALALGVALWRLRHRHRGPLAAYLFFVGSLFPVMGFFNLYAFRYAFVADHWQYLPGIGILVALAAGLVRLGAALDAHARWLGRAGGTFLLATLAVLAWRATLPYDNLETFYRTIIARNPSSRLAYANLGSLLLPAGDLRTLATRFTAIRAPWSSSTRPARWALTARSAASESAAPAAPLSPAAQRIADTFQLYQQALTVDPDNPEALSNLGFLLTQFGQLDAGVPYLEHALRVRPEFPEALLNLGNALLAQGRVDAAIRSLRLALQSRPGFDAAGDCLGNALVRAGRVDEAIAQYQDTLRLHPGFVDARINLGTALVRADRLPDALAQYEIALRQAPDRAEAHNNLGFALLRLGRCDDAIARFQRALELAPDYTTARHNLALAHQEARNSAR